MCSNLLPHKVVKTWAAHWVLYGSVVHCSGAIFRSCIWPVLKTHKGWKGGRFQENMSLLAPFKSRTGKKNIFVPLLHFFVLIFQFFLSLLPLELFSSHAFLVSLSMRVSLFCNQWLYWLDKTGMVRCVFEIRTEDRGSLCVLHWKLYKNINQDT